MGKRKASSSGSLHNVIQLQFICKEAFRLSFLQYFADDKSSSNQKNNQHKVRKGKNTVDDNKIHYVLAPKKIAEKREQIKNTEKEEKQKSHLKQSKCSFKRF